MRHVYTFHCLAGGSDMATMNPRGIVPDNLLDPSQRAAVIKWLLLAPHTGAWKVDLLRGWFAEMGLTGTAAEYQLVQNAGYATTPVRVQK